MLLTQLISRSSAQKANIQLLTCSFHKSSTVMLDKRWRLANRLTKNPNAFGPLTNMADYSFKDGRPTPFGIKQMIRINKNREYLAIMKKLSGEIDYAVERHDRLEKEKALEKQRIIDSKLKPKGHLLT